ncbi:hypothetical protein E4U31_006549 [Claviceps sp. LM219 group G6]|nr:hypothetical protein E4U31_006549 [Claviceps sp. LM219 group G6]
MSFYSVASSLSVLFKVSQAAGPWGHIARRRPSDNEGLSSVNISSGHFTVNKKTHLPSEYASDPLICVNSFSNYIYVYYRLFGREHPDATYSLTQSQAHKFVPTPASDQTER